MNWKKLDFTIEGLTPLMHNNPASMGQSKVGTKKVPKPEDEAASKVYELDDGRFCQPTRALYAATLTACKGVRAGRVGLGTILKGAILAFVPEKAVLTWDGEPIEEYEIDVRRAVIGRSGILRARPTFNPWALSFSIIYDEDYVSDYRTMLVETMERAGVIVGIGDFRPEKSGPFGRFEVASIGDPEMATPKDLGALWE